MTHLKILPMWGVSPQNVPQIEQKNDPQAGKTARIQILSNFSENKKRAFNARYFRYIVSNFRANWPPQFGDLVSYFGEFLLFFDYRNFEAL